MEDKELWYVAAEVMRCSGNGPSSRMIPTVPAEAEQKPHAPWFLSCPEIWPRREGEPWSDEVGDRESAPGQACK